jgi:hypothetical protein
VTLIQKYNDGETMGIQYNCILLDAQENVAVAKAKLKGQPKTRFVAVRRQRGVVVFWYAFTVEEALARITQWPDDASLVDGLNLHESDAAPTEDRGAAAPSLAPVDQPTVVIDGARFIGIRPPGGEPDIDLERAARLATTLGPFDGLKLDTRLPPGTGPAAPSTTPKSGEPRDEMDTMSEFSAYPKLRAPKRVEPRQRFNLFVGLVAQPDSETAASPVRIALPSQVREFELEIHVLAPGFDASNGWRHVLEVERANPEANHCEIMLVAPEVQGDALLSEITVFYVYKNMPCGMAVWKLEVVPAGTQPYADPRGAGIVWGADQGGASAVHVIPDVPSVDLVVCIKPDANPASGQFHWSFFSPHAISLPQKPVPPINLGTDAADFAAKLIQGVRDADGTEALRFVLPGLGARVAEKVPPEFWKALRQVWDQVRKADPKGVPTVLLATAESSMPWELAYLQSPLDAQAPPYLGAQVNIARWLLPLGGSASPMLPPAASIEVRHVAVVIGNYLPTSGLNKLEHAEAEGEHLKDQYDATKLDAALPDVAKLLKAKLPSGGAEAVHFACHGGVDTKTPLDAAIILSQGERMEPLWLLNVPLGQQYNPLLFLNACQVGTAGDALGSFSGFAGESLRGGFRAFVAPLWYVDDAIALQIAKSFYERAFGDRNKSKPPEPVANILRDLRCRFDPDSEKKSATWLAYVFYGHPNLALAAGGALKRLIRRHHGRKYTIDHCEEEEKWPTISNWAAVRSASTWAAATPCAHRD